jgi:hypothetical protein
MNRYAPAGAIRVADKRSSAVVYLYTTSRGAPAAIAYHGRAEKQDWWHSFKDEARREAYVRSFFAGRQAIEQRARDRRAERSAFRHGYKVGDLFRAMWGYDQTNIDLYDPGLVKIPLNGSFC